MPPTIVLVHGAFAESASWDRVIRHLEDAGHDAIAAANPLRGLAADAQSITDLVSTIDGPVVLVGHSYGGAVITNVDANAGEITGLVYVAAFAPEPGESANLLAQRFPGSTLGDALRPVPRSNGTTDLYIAREIFHEQFAVDVPTAEAARMAATQRPVTLEALQAPSGERPLWKQVPSWYLVAGQDRNIPAALQHFMAHRAGARRTVELPTASHAVAVSHPDATARLILEAVAAPVSAAA
jgi:pimeloyl-ACP methyl ester carboxylesterase